MHQRIPKPLALEDDDVEDAKKVDLWGGVQYIYTHTYKVQGNHGESNVLFNGIWEFVGMVFEAMPPNPNP